MVKVNFKADTRTGIKGKRSTRRQVDAIRKRVAQKGKKWDSAKIIRAIRDGK